MFNLENTIVSEEILDNEFVCNLDACKGACCIDGDAGAPLEESETEILVDIYARVKPYLREEGVKVIESEGAFVKGDDGEWETPLINKEECAYVIYSEKGIAKCGIEEAYNQGAIQWKKPLSCHLYPVRIKEYKSFTAVNYHKWQICDPACTLGMELSVPIYVFVKDALIRKFGSAWYTELESIAKKKKAKE